MKNVPLNRLLIQPTVQLKWIEQHREIELMLTADLQLRFDRLWKCYKNSQFGHIHAFLNSDLACQLNLVEDDELFALVVGADYIASHHNSFGYVINQPNLVWRI